MYCADNRKLRDKYKQHKDQTRWRKRVKGSTTRTSPSPRLSPRPPAATTPTSVTPSHPTSTSAVTTTPSSGRDKNYSRSLAPFRSSPQRTKPRSSAETNYLALRRNFNRNRARQYTSTTSTTSTTAPPPSSTPGIMGTGHIFNTTTHFTTILLFLFDVEGGEECDYFLKRWHYFVVANLIIARNLH